MSQSEEDERFVIVYGPELSAYTFSDDHPLQPCRHGLTMSLLSTLGWLDDPRIVVQPPRPATVAELLSAHSYPYIQAVEHAQAIARRQRPYLDLSFYGLGAGDNPIFDDIADAAALYVGASVVAMEAVLGGDTLHAYNPAGGMHHAMKGRASGFCIFNDIAVAINAALAAGRCVAYVDLDAHHGDGVQAAFYDDPRVLTISIHESGRFLFPGTGDIDETGNGAGRGTNLNIPLPPLAGDEAILAAVERIVEPAVRAFAPSLLVTQTGCDTHHSDPLTHLGATLALYPAVAHLQHRLAHQVCGGSWLIVGGGGYDPADVTPRAWTAFFGTVLGHETEGVALPEEWRQASRAEGGSPPAYLLDDTGPRAGATRPPVEQMEEVLAEIEDTALAELIQRHGSR